MTQDFKKNFGAKVKHYRKLMDYSQEDLAEKLGVSSNTVSYIERGKNSISFAKIPALSSALNIEPYKLFINDVFEPDKSKCEIINKLIETANVKQLNIIINLIKDIIET